MLKRICLGLLCVVAAVAAAAILSLAWLWWESSKPDAEWSAERQGRIVAEHVEESTNEDGQLSATVRLVSDSGLEISFKILRTVDAAEALPVLMILGGYRTGSRVVELFSDVSKRSVLGVEYPYAGPDKVKGFGPIVDTIPLVRQAFRDTVPAVSLVLDWLARQPWVDQQNIVLVGASLGVPFAATAAARDERITSLMLVHGAADNRLWIETALAQRFDSRIAHYPLSKVLWWMVYGPVLDTPVHVASLSPRPVLIVGAREDERTPAGQEVLLFEAAGEPRRLRYTDGQHVEPDREHILLELWRILEEEQSFLSGGQT